MPATLLELCGQWLRSSLGGDRLCLAECEPQTECCPPAGSMGDWYPVTGQPPIPLRAMFRRFSFASICCTEFEVNEEQTTTSTFYFNGEITRQTTATLKHRGSLNGANSGVMSAGACSWSWYIPIREQFEEHHSVQIGDPGSDTGDVAWQDERCLFVLVSPWPRSEDGPHSGREIPLPMWNEFPRSFSERPYTYIDDTTTVGNLTTVVQSRPSWAWEAGNNTFRWTFEGISNTIRTQRNTHGDIVSVVRTVTRCSMSMACQAGWETNCDGTPGPTGCPIVEAECNPGVLKFVVGRRCDLGAVGARPFVLPEFAVQNCGTIPGPDGQCYTFAPDSPRVIDPASINAQVGLDYIGPASIKTCCDCGSGCNRIDLGLGDNAEWMNGLRGPDGVFRTSTAVVVGRCCCFPQDVFRLIYQWTTLTAYNGDGSIGWSERFDIVSGITPRNLLGGFRRDDMTREQIGYGLRLRVMDGSGNTIEDYPNWQEIICAGPNTAAIGCVWGGLASPSAVQEYSFRSPLNAEGMHVRAQNNQIPFPWDQGLVNGGNGVWWINQYSIAVNCGALGAAAEWTRTENGNPLGRVTLRLQAGCAWSLTSSPLAGDPCSGGCEASTAPAQPVAPINPETLPGLRAITGGI